MARGAHFSPDHAGAIFDLSPVQARVFSTMVCVVPRRYAGIVFSIRVKDPQSFGGRFWNLAQNVWGMVPLAFIVLKLTGVISWSWWWVLSPWWIGGILFVLYLPVLWVLLSLFGRSRMSLPDQPMSEDGTSG